MLLLSSGRAHDDPPGCGQVEGWIVLGVWETTAHDP